MPNKYADPTKTLTLRNLAVSKINARFNEIKRVVTETIVENDVLTNAEPADKARFIFKRDAGKVEEFSAWLHEQVSVEILATGAAASVLLPPPDIPRTHWLNTYIGSAYARGAAQTQRAVARHYADRGLPGDSVLTHPAHVSRAELIYARVYSDLRGVTETMEAQMARALTDGIIQGQGIREISRNLNDRVDKIGKVRSRLIARTEIINAHGLASIIEAENLEGLVGETIFMKWRTAIDGRQRHSHELRNNQIYTKEQAVALLGEPNCRCSVTAWVDEFGDL